MYADHSIYGVAGYHAVLRRRDGDRLTGLLIGAYRAVRDRFRRDSDYQRLLDMPDYLLDDIGLTRAQIRARFL